jgi:uncharacterized protein (TIGR00255 family)
MTGFARAEAVHPWGTLSCEIRSVNHRYLELQLRVPEALRHAEHASRELLRERLGRGKVDCSLRLQDSAGAAGAEGGVLRVDEDRLAQLLAACARIDTVAPGLARPTTLEMLAWPGVLAEEAPDADTTAGAMLALVERTARELVEAREREGARLGALLTQRLSGIEELVATVSHSASRSSRYRPSPSVWRRRSRCSRHAATWPRNSTASPCTWARRAAASPPAGPADDGSIS